MGKVQLTFITKAGDEIVSCPFQPRWVECNEELLSEESQAKLKQWQVTPYNELSAELWSKLKPTNEELSKIWESCSNIREELEYTRTVLPLDLKEIYDRIVRDGIHTVKAPASMFDVLDQLLAVEAEMESDRCNYELSVLCGALKGNVQ